MEQAVEPNFIGTLGLNWKLFLAQLINFGIVVFILWKWVFKPVTSALEARRQRIEESVKTAEEIEKRLQEFEAHRETQMRKAQAQAEALIQKAEGLASESKSQILEMARLEARKLLAEAKTAIATEKEQMLREIREEVATLTVMATEKILREKLDEKKDKEIINNALRAFK